ncbi:MAG: hypothetical protein WCO25_02390 [Candidatus Uhrbacteria bacterium]
MSRFVDRIRSTKGIAIGFAILLLAGGLFAIFVRTNGMPKTDEPPSAEPSTTLIQRCPDAWYTNRMPTVADDGRPTMPSEYVVIDGKRMELSQMDMAWVGANCSVDKKTVY